MIVNTSKDAQQIIGNCFHKDYKKIPESVKRRILFFMIYNKSGKHGFVIGSLYMYMIELLKSYLGEEALDKPGLKEFINTIQTSFAVDINSLSTDVCKFYLKRESIRQEVRDLYRVREEADEDTVVFYYDVKKDRITHYKHYISTINAHKNLLFSVDDQSKPIMTQKCNITYNSSAYYDDTRDFLQFIDKKRFFLASSYRDGGDSTYLYIKPRPIKNQTMT